MPKRHRRIQETGHIRWREARSELRDLLGSGYIAALIGPRGTGKTQLAAEVIAAVTKQNRAAKYMLLMEFFNDLKDRFSKKASVKEYLEQYRSCPLVVFDEVAVRSESDWENHEFTHVIDMRYGAEVDTILISNQEPEVFRRSVGESIWSRLTETGGLVACDWPSYRKPKE